MLFYSILYTLYTHVRLSIKLHKNISNTYISQRNLNRYARSYIEKTYSMSNPVFGLKIGTKTRACLVRTVNLDPELQSTRTSRMKV